MLSSRFKQLLKTTPGTRASAKLEVRAAGTLKLAYEDVVPSGCFVCRVWVPSVGAKCGGAKCGCQVWVPSVGAKCGCQVWVPSVGAKCG